MAEQVRVAVTMNEEDVQAGGRRRDVSGSRSMGHAGRGNQEAAAR